VSHRTQGLPGNLDLFVNWKKGVSCIKNILSFVDCSLGFTFSKNGSYLHCLQTTQTEVGEKDWRTMEES
jgi:hypothetical protein